MGKSNVPWTKWTWNPWLGCHKKSDGCRNCYMYREQERYGRDPYIVFRSKTTFSDPLKWQKKAAAAGVKELVFTCSWSDFFIEDADPIRNEAWEIIRSCPNLVFQILTKRPERIAQCLPDDWGQGYPNVWMGVSVENQAAANLRIPILQSIPAVVRFLSCEPLLEPIDLLQVVKVVDDCRSAIAFLDTIHWVIVGGETGPQARRMQHSYVSPIKALCSVLGIPFFFKSWGEWIDTGNGQFVHGDHDARRLLDGHRMEAFPEGWDICQSST